MRFIRRRKVEEKTSFSKATIYRRINEGTFPRPYPMDESGRSVAWLEEEIDAWLADRVTAGRKQHESLCQETRTAA